MLKPRDVIRAVKEKTKIELTQSNHTDLWKLFGVRPNSKAESKFDTLAEYCIYDEPHNDYLYTSEWVDFVVGLVQKHNFNKENIHSKCKQKLKIEDFN